MLKIQPWQTTITRMSNELTGRAIRVPEWPFGQGAPC